MDSFITEKIIANINEHKMIAAGDTVVAAVSGGADSMCLLHFLYTNRETLGIKLICAHVNHLIRGEQAFRDEKLVEDFCKENNIAFELARFDVPNISKETGESLEECGRRLRYEFFGSICENAKIATAHNLNDCAETVLFNLARGTGLKGLLGIPPVRDNIIRPIICLERGEIESYCDENSVSYVIDSTNLSTDYSRNKIRHIVLPALNEINNSCISSIASCMKIVGDAEKFIKKKSREAFYNIYHDEAISIDGLLALDDIIRDNVLIIFCQQLGAKDISFNHIELIKACLSGGAVMLPGGVTLESDGKRLFKRAILNNERIFKKVSGSGEYEFPFCKITLTIIDKQDNIKYNKLIKSGSYFDATALENAVFRSREEGDRFKFPNATHSKSMKNLYKEKGITQKMRQGIPLLANDKGIIWVDGVGVSDKGKITEKTKSIVRLSITKN